MKIFNYHPTSGLLIGESVADESPLDEGVFLVPAFATKIIPPEPVDGKNVIFSDGRWALVDIPQPVPDPVPDQLPPSPITRITALQGLLAIDQAGLSSSYDAWANDPARTFAQRAFLNKAQTWKRDDPTLIAAATALGLTSAQVDSMFVMASSL